MDKVTTIGLDLAKTYFQVHGGSCPSCVDAPCVSRRDIFDDSGGTVRSCVRPRVAAFVPRALMGCAETSAGSKWRARGTLTDTGFLAAGLPVLRVQADVISRMT